MLKVYQVCYACTDIQVTCDCVRDERYQDPNKAFVTRDTTVTGHTPDYWQSSASSTTGSFVSVLELVDSIQAKLTATD
jgi:hypothetical protein